MPFYEYECKSCGHDVEVMQKISEPPLKKCPQCGKPQLQRLMSAPVFRLKGGGWYETDFKGDQDNKRNLADRPEPDAPKDAVTDTAKDAGKEGASGAESKDGDGKDAKTDSAAQDSKPKEKAADKPAKKAASKSAKEPKSSTRVHHLGRGKSAGKRPMKRPVHKATRRV
ncbi:MAG TPA: zinc ribbon domain-containing protein [Steroidobacteraceae bacterium]|jgi:putative FmdB family regulatory protein|nr:zinc ribbon domain-containing protein [Steroidobacteraceae bacterium]